MCEIRNHLRAGLLFAWMLFFVGLFPSLAQTAPASTPQVTVSSSPGPSQPSVTYIPNGYAVQDQVDDRQYQEPPAQPVTVKELEKRLAASGETNDLKRATELSGLVLTERVTAKRLAAWFAAYPGSKTREVLAALADASAFEPLPVEDAPTVATPGIAEQRQMMTRIGNYLSQAIPSLPNLIATRNTTYFEDHPWHNSLLTPNAEESPAPIRWPLHLLGRSKTVVANVNGKESTAKGDLETASYASRLTTAGEFGPILYGVMMDAMQNQLEWAGWEPGKEGVLAVFRFKASKEKSHYSLQPPNATKAPSEFVAYQGEIAVRPSDGAILRLTAKAQPYPFETLAMADIAVEYGPVEIGGRQYICPVHGIALSRVAVPAKKGAETPETTLFQTQLNDVVFEQYHVFRSKWRVVNGSMSAPLKTQPSSEAAP